MGSSKLIGAWGESVAADYLRRKRYKPVAVNYRCRFGEIDLIVSNGRQLVFVEVKTRKNDDFAQAKEFVDRNKQEKMRKTAAMWLAENPAELPVRFDVIEIYAPEGTATRRPGVRHLEDAFQ